jgi:hypothetical protein
MIHVVTAPFHLNGSLIEIGTELTSAQASTVLADPELKKRVVPRDGYPDDRFSEHYT